jgi:hypothetical protein
MRRFFGQQQPNDISQSLEISKNPALVTMTLIQFHMRLIYAATGKISRNFKNLKQALGTIRPTSTENERNFSTSGNFF